jgi:hypothetical protein
MTAPTQDAMAMVGQIIGHATGMVAIRLCAIGDRLDLFKTIAGKGPLTSAELAAETGLNERYLRSFREGGGIDYSRYNADPWEGLEHNTCVRQQNNALYELRPWQPVEPD